MSTRPRPVQCPPLTAFDPTDLAAVTAAFAGAPALDMHQAWLASPSVEFAPATVRVGWRDSALLVFASMTDADVRTQVTGHNQRFWELGDTCEIFLRPVDQAAYLEFHVAPNNFRLQLRFEDDSWMSAEPAIDPFAASVRGGELFMSQTWKTDAGWSVMATIPSASVCDTPRPLAGSIWLVSFSRYDVTGASGVPVISSTSPHAAPAFHRQQEWAELTFVAGSSE